MRLAQNWRLQRHHYRLIGSRCRACDSLAMPPRALCPACRPSEPVPILIGLALTVSDGQAPAPSIHPFAGCGASLVRTGIHSQYCVPQMCR